MNTYDFSGVPAKVVRSISEEVLALIEKALVYSLGEYLPCDLLTHVENGKMQLWEAADGHDLKGCVVTELINFDRKSVCQIVTVAGEEFSKWKYGYKLIEQWAFANGCEEVRFYGRPGWERVMKDAGYCKAYTVFSKELRFNDENLH